jgi:cysteine desulfurase
VKQIYLDHHATTPTDPRVVDVMLPYFTTHFGNASSREHAFGWTAAHAVERAREQVAALIGCTDPKEIIFTSGATEANNLAIKGITHALSAHGSHVVSVVTEHASVLEALAEAHQTLLPVNQEGYLSVAAVDAALTHETVLCCVMLANNEIGVIQPLSEIAAVCHARNVLLLSDAVQAAGHIPVDVTALGVDALTLSAHKLHGPKGVGALWLRRSKPRVPMDALLHGGGHERGYRAGTLNVPGIVGFGEAARIALLELASERTRVAQLRDRLFGKLRDVVLNGPSLADRLPHNLNVSVPGVDGETLLMELRDIAVSSGSACASASLAPSHVLRAIGRSDDLAHASLRFGLGRFTTEDEIDRAAIHVLNAIDKLKRKD